MTRVVFLSIALLSLSCAHQKQKRHPQSFLSCYETMAKFLGNKKFSGYGKVGFELTANLDDLEQRYGLESFFSIQSRLSEKEIVDNNQNLLKLLPKEPLPHGEGNKHLSINKKLAQDIYEAMTNTKMVRDDSCYQRPGVSIGYCFGRAIIAHMEALLKDVQPESTRKIWVVGDMGHWGHHVATMVRSEDGSWYVIDDFTRLVKVERWIELMKREKKSGAKELMFMVTSADRFGPESVKGINPVDLFNTTSIHYSRENDYYKGFFYDYFNELDKRLNPGVRPSVPEKRRWWQILRD